MVVAVDGSNERAAQDDFLLEENDYDCDVWEHGTTTKGIEAATTIRRWVVR